jgi:cephalosporin hydroxylase
MPSYDDEVADRVAANRQNAPLRRAAATFMRESITAKYSYNFSWLGRPIIQYPQDIVAVQQLAWAVQPDLVIETGIAHGGSLILWASLLELNAACGGPNGRVVGVDIEIRPHNRAAIEDHPLARRITMIEGSSTAPDVVRTISELAADRERILVSLDSNHTHDHVAAELEAYAPMTSVGSYCIVFDTVIEDLGPGTFPDRPWDVGNNPMTAVRAFLEAHPEFEDDRSIEDALLVTAAPGGYLRRVRR